MGGVKREDKEYKRVDPLYVIPLKLFIGMVPSSPADHNVPFNILTRRTQFVLEQIFSFFYLLILGKVGDVVTCSKRLYFMRFKAGYFCS